MAGRDGAIGTVFLGTAEIVWREQVLPPLIRSASAARRLAINARIIITDPLHNTRSMLAAYDYLRLVPAAGGAVQAARVAGRHSNAAPPEPAPFPGRAAGLRRSAPACR